MQLQLTFTSKKCKPCKYREHSAVLLHSTGPRYRAYRNTSPEQWSLQKSRSFAVFSTCPQNLNSQVTSKVPTKRQVPPSYQRQQLREFVSARPWLVFTRCLQVGVAAARLNLLHKEYHQLRQQAAVTSQHGDHPSPAAASSYSASVQQLVSELGPLWVKLGQTLSVRPDILGDELANALAGLQDGAPPFSNAVAADVISEDLGAGPDELFSSISPEPAASASLGQVYQATLAQDERLVAVKVQRPGTWPQLQLDLAVLLSLLTVIKAVASLFGRKQDITAWADTLGQGLAQELDYVQEARNLELFAAAHSHLQFMTTPEVVWQLTSTRVLCTTWVNGQAPKQLLKQAKYNTASPPNKQQHPYTHSTNTYHSTPHTPQHQLSRLVALGIESSLNQLVVTGVLHADPHPGNILLTAEGQLAYLDFGLLVRVPQKASMAMMSGLIHWALADWSALCEDFDNMGLLKPNTDKQQLTRELQTQFTELYNNNIGNQPAPTENQAGADSLLDAPQQGPEEPASTLLEKAGAISFSDFAKVVSSLALRFRFDLPPWYTLVIRSLVTLEGFAVAVDPQMKSNITQSAVKVVASQLLQDNRPEAQQLLQQVLKHPKQQGCLNLPLLNELLQMQHTSSRMYSSSSRSRSSGKQSADLQLSHTSTKPPRVSAGLPWQQVAALLPAFDPRSVAAQLSGPEGAPIREAVAQYLLSDRLSQQQAEVSVTRAAGRQAVEKPVAHTQKGFSDSSDVDAAVTELWRLRRRPVWSKWPASVLLRWLHRAGWHGLLLVCQFFVTTLKMAFKLLLSRVQQGIASSRQRVRL